MRIDKFATVSLNGKEVYQVEVFIRPDSDLELKLLREHFLRRGFDIEMRSEYEFAVRKGNLAEDEYRDVLDKIEQEVESLHDQFGNVLRLISLELDELKREVYLVKSAAREARTKSEKALEVAGNGRGK